MGYRQAAVLSAVGFLLGVDGLCTHEDATTNDFLLSHLLLLFTSYLVLLFSSFRLGALARRRPFHQLQRGLPCSVAASYRQGHR